MPTTLPNMSIQLPALGGDSGTWDDTINLSLGLIDAHDHTSGKGLRIKTAAISIDADLSFASTFAPTNLHRITFASVAALSGSNKSLFVNTSDNELYWRSNTGVNVKLTAGSALNVGSFAGTFSGDFVSAGAVAAFDDAGERFTFKKATNWKKVSCGGLQLFELATSESVSVNLAAPAALGASYTVTWPLAVPGATVPVTMDSSGVLAASTTLSNLTAITLTSGSDVTISGSGNYNRGAKVRSIPIYSGQAIGAGGTFANDAFNMSAGTAQLHVALVVDEGERITSVAARVFDSGTDVLNLKVFRLDATGTGMVRTQLGSTATSTGAAGSNETITVSGLTETVGTSQFTYVAEFTITGFSAGCGVRSILLTTDVP